MELLKQLSDNLIKRIDTRYLRYMYHRIPWSNRMTALVGPRGVGKTTLLLQYIKLNLQMKDTLYVSAESIYFANHTLFETAMKFSQLGGKHLFIDEIHKYKGWATELKMIYDNLPTLQVVFTGSSVLDISVILFIVTNLIYFNPYFPENSISLFETREEVFLNIGILVSLLMITFYPYEMEDDNIVEKEITVEDIIKENEEKKKINAEMPKRKKKLIS